MKVPLAVGVPLIVMVFDPKAAVTPEGNPVAVPIPVAPVVAWVILVNKVLIHNDGVDEGAAAVLFGVTVINTGSEFADPQTPLTTALK